jgi:hypothetical protein
LLVEVLLPVGEVVAVPAYRGGLAARHLEFAAGGTAAAGGAPGADQQQAQPDQSDHDAVEKQHAGRAGDVVAEHGEIVGQRVVDTPVGQHPREPDHYGRDQNDQPDDDDHCATH